MTSGLCGSSSDGGCVGGTPQVGGERGLGYSTSHKIGTQGPLTRPVGHLLTALRISACSAGESLLNGLPYRPMNQSRWMSTKDVSGTREPMQPVLRRWCTSAWAIMVSSEVVVRTLGGRCVSTAWPRSDQPHRLHFTSLTSGSP